ncbi:sensor histidine kinase [Glaciimonas soli]|uniref:Sensor histidine kinase n=1 Tax=Glaciimonas soli TaxID=2590999 RepID=A0A843YPA4_9BURK|nr:histidine kinase [Glaciimonas soli]MQR00830.1 sensor histidine kinase [Glaciimonas soli]
MNRRIWPFYLAAWVPVFIFYAIATQEGLVHGHLELGKGLKNAGLILGPGVFILFLLWPLTGYFQRVGRSTIAVLGIHAGLALLFTLFCVALDYVVIFHFNQQNNDLSEVVQMLTWQSLVYLMTYAIIAGIFHAVRARETTRLQSIAISQAQTLLAKSELTALRNKLNPHFLFNTLHSIIALTRKDSSAAETALLKFSDMLRYLLDTEKSGDSMVMLDDELTFVRDYLALESLRLCTRLTVEWDIDDAVLCRCVPALSVQPLVENSIKHAFNPRSQPGTLKISAKMNEDTVSMEIVVSDDGPGSNLYTVKNASGLGVKTVERRLALEYGERAKVEIHTEPGAGFAIHLTIPLKTD